MEKTIKSYFILKNNQIIYPAKIWKRICARIFDFSIVLSLPLILSSVFFSHNLSNKKYPPAWNDIFLITNIISIFLTLFIFIIIPSLNKNYRGQTIGKKIFKISVLFFDKKTFLNNLILRELPLSFLFILPIILKLISGYEPIQIISIYSKLNIKWDSANLFTFLFQKWIKGDIKYGLQYLSIWQTIFIVSSWLISFIQIFISISILFSMISSKQNIGWQDEIGNTAIVNLKTLKNNLTNNEGEKNNE